jgi:predicted kinase
MSTNKPELVICRGLQASGKTTYAHNWVAENRKDRARVNRDDLREMFDKSEYVEGVTEGRILVARDALITSLLRRGVSVISDDTNLSSRNVRDLAKMAVHGSYDWRIEDFCGLPLETCLARNALRNDRYIARGQARRVLDQKVIIKTYERFIKGKTLPLPLPANEQLTGGAEGMMGAVYQPDDTLPDAVIVDIDGTIALRGTRNPFDESRVSEDAPNIPVIEAVWNEHANGVKIIFCSGRTSACRDATIEWLKANVLPERAWAQLYMRPEGDRRVDWEVKLEIFDEHIRDSYNVLRVYDDRQQVVDMWRSIGLTVLQVAPGNF